MDGDTRRIQSDALAYAARIAYRASSAAKAPQAKDVAIVIGDLLRELSEDIRRPNSFYYTSAATSMSTPVYFIT